jgi:hypothetical protein
MFRPLTGIYEPSAIQQLPDGRFLVAEDEEEFPFALVSVTADGSASSVPLQLTGDDEEGGIGKLADLEALTINGAGNIYAITSHSRNTKGEEKKSREKLLRFRVEGNRMVSPVVVKNLKAALVAAHPVLALAAAVLEVKNDGGLNIEALEMAPDGQRLLVGFRSPLLGGQAILASLDNPAAAFDGAEPRISPSLAMLDCGGHGLRALSWVPALNGYLLVSGPVAREQVQFRLWYWRGTADDRPRPASVAELPGFEHAEGISPAIVAGLPKLMIVSDDGSREEGRSARYLLLDVAQIRIES